MLKMVQISKYVFVCVCVCKKTLLSGRFSLKAEAENVKTGSIISLGLLKGLQKQTREVLFHTKASLACYCWL